MLEFWAPKFEVDLMSWDFIWDLNLWLQHISHDLSLSAGHHLTVWSLVLQSSFNLKFISESLPFKLNCTSLAMSTSQLKTKSSLSLFSLMKRLLATHFQLKSTLSTQPHSTHNPPLNIAVANSTLNQQNCDDIVNNSDMAPRSSEDSAWKIASGKTNALYESPAHWVWSIYTDSWWVLNNGPNYSFCWPKAWS